MAHTAQSLDDQATAIKLVGNTAISIAASGVTVGANKFQEFVNRTNESCVLWNALGKNNDHIVKYCIPFVYLRCQMLKIHWLNYHYHCQLWF